MKSIALLFTCTLLLALAGCQQNEETTGTSSSTVAEITASSEQSAESTSQENHQLQSQLKNRPK